MSIFLKILGVFFLGEMLTLCGCRKFGAEWNQLYQVEAEDTNPIDSIEPTPEERQAKRVICVYVCGAVVNPGVYELPEGARVIQVIDAAGGLTEDADVFLENQARVVEDGEQIRIYTKDEAKARETQPREDSGIDSDGKVNINTAAAEVLMTLSGIGEAKAEAIIAYREANGGFNTIEDLMLIPGIKEAVFSKIRDKITV